MKQILFFTNREDVHADYLLQKLKERDERVFRFNAEDYPVHIDFSIFIEGNEFLFQIKNRKKGLEITERDVKSIWFRRRTPLGLEGISQEYKPFTSHEIKELLNGFFMTTKIKCVNNPLWNEIANNKIYNLYVAASIGFQIPKTLYTNVNLKVLSLMESEREIIYKAFGNAIIIENAKSKKVVLTNKLCMDNDLHREIIRENSQACPGVYQPFLNKSFELRITVVGEKLFSCAIYNQEAKEERISIDWRINANSDEIKYEQFDLPEQIERQCLELVKNLNLYYGAIDMIVTKNGEFIFLEINPNGQWLWIEQKTNLKISECICDLLSRE